MHIFGIFGGTQTNTKERKKENKQRKMKRKKADKLLLMWNIHLCGRELQ